MNLDVYLFQKINGLAGTWFWLDSLVIFLAEYFGYIVVAILFIFFLKKKKDFLIFLTSLLAALLARFGVVELIRWIWLRPRPFVENYVNLLLDKVNQASFPSGHAAFFFALSTAIFLYNKKVYPLPKFWWGVGILLFIASILISLARIFCGIHWPSDILAGAVVGIIIGWLIGLIKIK